MDGEIGRLERTDKRGWGIKRKEAKRERDGGRERLEDKKKKQDNPKDNKRTAV